MENVTFVFWLLITVFTVITVVVIGVSADARASLLEWAAACMTSKEGFLVLYTAVVLLIMALLISGYTIYSFITMVVIPTLREWWGK